MEELPQRSFLNLLLLHHNQLLSQLPQAHLQCLQSAQAMLDPLTVPAPAAVSAPAGAASMESANLLPQRLMHHRLKSPTHPHLQSLTRFQVLHQQRGAVW